MRILTLCLWLATGSVLADWQLDSDNSSLHFISTKNEHISEMHTFDRVSGNLTEAGKLSINVDLTSVNTMIDIRNSRMQSMLFNVDSFASATFSADLPANVMALPPGGTMQMQQSGVLSLHGVEASVTFEVRVVRLSESQLLAYTVKPTIINASQFGLTAGVQALQKIAGLNSISYAVPVSFSVVMNSQ